jgi:hypothetical protein
MLVAKQHTLRYLYTYLHSVGKEHGFHSLVQMEEKARLWFGALCAHEANPCSVGDVPLSH